MTNRKNFTAQEIKDIVRDKNVRAVSLWFVDLEGHLKGFSMSPDELDRALETGMNFDGSSITGFNAIQESDLTAKPDLSTFSLIPGNDGEFLTARMFADIVNPDGSVFSHDPRYILRAQLEKASKLGYTYYVGPELEFFLFKSMDVPPIPMDEGTYFTNPPVDAGSNLRTEIMEALNAMGIRVEYHHHEVAPSQHEIDLRYDEALSMADSAITYKFLAKQIAFRNKCYLTFMPKPLNGVNGSGMHIHMSLFKNGKNTFYDPSDKYQLSDIAKSYIAGVLREAPAMTAFLAQYVNSYKRLVPGFEAPVYISWSPVNRSALIRVPAFPKGKSENARCELRCADPSCNYYFAFALMLAAGLKGIEEKMELEEPVLDNLYELTEMEREKRGIKSLPSNLHEALHFAKRSEFVREVLGDEVTEQFLEIKYGEWAEYQRHVSEWELKRYFSVL
jgi:glutamine synthetase